MSYFQLLYGLILLATVYADKAENSSATALDKGHKGLGLLSRALANEQPAAVLEIYGNTDKSEKRGNPVAVLKIFNNDLASNFLKNGRSRAGLAAGPKEGTAPITLDTAGMRLQLRPSGNGNGITIH